MPEDSILKSKREDVPQSVESFERQHEALLGAVENVVRRVMDPKLADDGSRQGSGDVHRFLDLQLVVPDVPLVFGDALHGISKRDEGSLKIIPLSCIPGVLRGVFRFASHVLTSFACLGALIISFKCWDRLTLLPTKDKAA